MRTRLTDEPVLAALRTVQREIFAEQPDRLHRLRIELDRDADHVPVATQEIPHRRSRADLGEPFVLFARRCHSATFSVKGGFYLRGRFARMETTITRHMRLGLAGLGVGSSMFLR